METVCSNHLQKESDCVKEDNLQNARKETSMDERAIGGGNPSAAMAWRSLGFWMVAAMALLQGVYAVQAFLSPDTFAASRGTPLVNSGDPAWILTYACRTIFVSLTIMLLLARGAMSTLRWVALLALVMPVGDLLIALDAGAPRANLLRHVGTIAYLAATFAVITRWLHKTRLS